MKAPRLKRLLTDGERQALRQGLRSPDAAARSACVAPKASARLEWSVLDWNAPAIGFYRALTARPQDEWTVYRLDGAALARLADPGATGLYPGRGPS